MPTGLLGLTVAGITAALMGHISATYNSVATLVTRDFYLRWRPAALQEQQIRVGRIVVLAVFVLGALWAPIIGHFKSLWIYLQSVQAYLMMPFAGIFLAGVLWKRTTSQGVLACAGSACALAPLFMVNGHRHFLPFMEHPLLRPWLHAAMVSFAICLAVLISVSLATTRPAPERLIDTTVEWSGSSLAAKEERQAGFGDYRLWFSLLIVLATVLWWWRR
jgi:SSS family solute:Na+ symporter